MKVGFVTCVELGLACMRAIYDTGGRLDFAITLPDWKAPRKSGRVFIDEFCKQHAIDLFKTASINDPECIAFLESQKADHLFIIGWSQIAGLDVLRAVRQVIGAHPTLLPEGRGRAAIPWAIIKGLNETGVTFFLLDEGVDSGDILAQQRISISPEETATTLYDRVTSAHATLIQDVCRGLMNGNLAREPQDHSKATVWPARTPADGELRTDMTVTEAHRLVRATTRPYPGAFVRLDHRTLLRVWAGRPASSAAESPGIRRLSFVDGAYDALDWEIDET